MPIELFLDHAINVFYRKLEIQAAAILVLKQVLGCRAHLLLAIVLLCEIQSMDVSAHSFRAFATKYLALILNDRE